MKMTNELESRICELYLNGETYDSICEKLNLSNHTQISKIVKKHNLPPPQAKRICVELLLLQENYIIFI